ncbi:hypothetical protein C5167_021783 [Papaver somniferum]|uniref:Cytochrome b5 heme-binding domain-containing protein n=1 Tax=Papaver somniferum TaxID=3469 RepID=A0A4Y7JG16_PAPSO|nr:cytochrome b5-like [Papaver somniferum]RZC60033.1 hypothetical protein C5167_021783 [Papaver somniferum]
MSNITKLYTVEEASKHNTKQDCWLILDGKVYNVTKYLDDHPGGDDVLVNATGRDAIEDFDFVGHSKSARELMDTYLIGELDPSSIPQQEDKATTTRHQQQKDQVTQKSQDSSAFNYWFISLVILVISVIAGGYLYFPSKDQ